MSSALAGKIALVTGGASGIGLATGQRFAAEGAAVVAVDVDVEAGVRAATAVGGDFFRADVSDPNEMTAAVEFAEERYGGLDVAHLNAGIDLRVSDPGLVTPEQYERMMGVNVAQVVFGTTSAASSMERRGGGVIVVTASLAGLGPFPSDPLYTLTKHAVVGWVRGCAPALESKKVRINCICPGYTDTPMIVGEARRRFAEAGFPLLDADDVATAALVAATDGGTGQAFICQPGRPVEAYRFRGVPGPRVDGATGLQAPPLDEGAP
jgi:NAD(P)-dependent dehydrogenase (short-subunit alcohol dehydrogenase family)